MTNRRELPRGREHFGFPRTVCGCLFCQAPCRHVPGSLDVADLTRLVPEGEDVFAWAERHLRAQTDKSYPVLVPARGPDGACHWLVAGRCAVHENAPYGCAFFDAHMDDPETARRVAATVKAIRDDAAALGLYFRVWRHLVEKDSIVGPGNRAALEKEVSALRRALQS